MVPSVALRNGRAALELEAFAVLYNFLKLDNRQGRNKKKIHEVRKFYYPFAICNFGTQKNAVSMKSIAIDIGEAFWNEDFSYYGLLEKEKSDPLLHQLPDKPSSLEDEPNALVMLSGLGSLFKEETNTFPVARSSWFKDVARYASPSSETPQVIYDEAHYDTAEEYAYRLALALDQAKTQRDYLIQSKALVSSKIESFQKHLHLMLSSEKEYALRSVARFVEDTSPDVCMFDSLLETFTEDVSESIRSAQSSSERDMDSIEHLIAFERREIQRMGPLREQAFRNEIGRIQNVVEVNQAQLLSLYKVGKQLDEAMLNANNGLRKASEDMRNARVRLRQLEQAPIRSASEEEDTDDDDRVFLNGLLQKHSHDNNNNNSSKKMTVSSASTSPLLNGNGNGGGGGAKTKAALALESFALRKQIAEMELRYYDSIALRVRSDIDVAHEQIRILRRALGESLDDLDALVAQANDEVQNLLREARARCESTVAARVEYRQMIERQFARIESPRQFIITILEGAQALFPAEVERHSTPIKERIVRLSKALETIEPKFAHAISSCEDLIKKIEGVTFDSVPSGIYFVPFWQFRWQDDGGIQRSTIYSLAELNEDSRLLPIFPELEFPPEKAPLPDPSGRILILESEQKAMLREYSLPKGALKIGSFEAHSYIKELRKLAK